MTERVSKYLYILAEYEDALDGGIGDDENRRFVGVLEQLWFVMTDADRFAIERELTRDLDVSVLA